MSFDATPTSPSGPFNITEISSVEKNWGEGGLFRGLENVFECGDVRRQLALSFLSLNLTRQTDSHALCRLV